MNEPQVWVLIGVFGTALFTIMALVYTFSTRILRSEVGRIEGILLVRFDGIDRQFQSIDRRFEAMDKRFESMDKRFDRLESKVEALDRDVSAIFRRLGGSADLEG